VREAPSRPQAAGEYYTAKCVSDYVAVRQVAAVAGNGVLEDEANVAAHGGVGETGQASISMVQRRLRVGYKTHIQNRLCRRVQPYDHW